MPVRARAESQPYLRRLPSESLLLKEVNLTLGSRRQIRGWGSQKETSQFGINSCPWVYHDLWTDTVSQNGGWFGCALWGIQLGKDGLPGGGGAFNPWAEL